ncbi:MAG: DUF87 domain-containing protein [Bacilli bacterium]
MIGNIIAIENNMIKVKLSIDINNQSNLINLHIIFIDGKRKVVGEILDINKDILSCNILGYILDDKFTPGSSKKPSFKSLVKLVEMDELELILGKQTIDSNTSINLGTSSIYPNYKVNVKINDFFSNHFAVLGNTGSGKSFTVSRILQNVFTSNNYVPINANIIIFDAYGEYKNAFANFSNISPMLNYKTYTTNTIYPSDEILNIPLWLLGVDDIALLLGASEHAQLAIIEKALKLVHILNDQNEFSIAYKNDIIAQTLLDILMSGKESNKIRDQITAVLSNFNTPSLNLESILEQPGYSRPLKQCIFVDKTGKMQEVELVVDYISSFINSNIEITVNNDVAYTLTDLENALDFALISEGILKSDKVFDYANILSVRLHTLVNSKYSKFFEGKEMITRKSYIEKLTHTLDGKKVQIINFNINYVDDTMAKTIVKIISKMIFDYTISLDTRASIPFHILIEEAHRYVQNDNDNFILGYNIFDRITKEGRKYGVLLGLITQRPSELSETSISQCSNFLVLRTLHPKDLEYIKNMVPNVSMDIVNSLKILEPGNVMAFGNAFSVPINIKIEKPNPEPLSNNANIVNSWF